MFAKFVQVSTEGFAGATLFEHTLTSLGRVFGAFALACLTAIPIGVMMGVSRVARGIFDPPIEFYRPLPPLAYLPMVIIWFGIGEFSKVFLIFLAIFAPMAIAARSGVRSVSIEQIHAAYSMGATRMQVIWHVILKSALPEIFTGMRIGIGVGWTTLVAGEMVASTRGPGLHGAECGRVSGQRRGHHGHHRDRLVRLRLRPADAPPREGAGAMEGQGVRTAMQGDPGKDQSATSMSAILAHAHPHDVMHESLRIAGEKVPRERVIEVRHPYTGELIATVPKASLDDVKRALRIARDYRAKLTRHERYSILMKAGEIVTSRRDEIARLITLESGLCLKDSQYEVGRASDVMLFAANQALVDDSQVFSCDLTAHGKSRKIYTLKEPLLGVITAITPFNHPLNQVIHKIAPAVATNNRVVLKPSEKTPLAALAIADILYEAGLPPQMLSVLTGDPAEIADELLCSPEVDLVTFTGGIAVGKYIAAKAIYKRQVLELGGNDPIIVMDDADIEEAATLAASGSYKNSGQRCTAIKRMLVHEKVADRFVELLVEKTRAVKYGDPFDANMDMGTVIDEPAAKRFETVVNEAITDGAKLLIGNARRGALYSPTVLDHVRPEMTVVREETFGPVSPVIRFKTLEQAIDIANGTAYGLSAALCTNRLDVITRVVQELQVGSVNVREVPGYRLEMTPFGGIKDSGLGYKEGVLEAMKSFCNTKTYSLPW